MLVVLSLFCSGISARLDCGHDTRYAVLAPHERWHWREDRRSPYESDVPPSAIKLRYATVDYENEAQLGRLAYTVRDCIVTAPAPQYHPRSQFLVVWFYLGSAAAVALILLARLSVPFLLLPSANRSSMAENITSGCPPLLTRRASWTLIRSSRSSRPGFEFDF
jgi:hypothetical protein